MSDGTGYPEHAEATLLVAALSEDLPDDVIRALSGGARCIEKQAAELSTLREASKTTALEIYRHSAMGGSEEGFLSYWDSAVESRMQLLKEQDNR